MNSEMKFRAWCKSKKKMCIVKEIRFSEFQDTFVWYQYRDDKGKLIGGASYVDKNGNGTIVLMPYSGFNDKDNASIYTGDIVQLVNEAGETVRALCEFGSVKREIYGNTVEIRGFYFKLLSGSMEGKKTFPIINNYAGKHDTELFKIIGNRWENPELLKNYKEIDK